MIFKIFTILFTFILSFGVEGKRIFKDQKNNIIYEDSKNVISNIKEVVIEMSAQGKIITFKILNKIDGNKFALKSLESAAFPKECEKGCTGVIKKIPLPKEFKIYYESVAPVPTKKELLFKSMQGFANLYYSFSNNFSIDDIAYPVINSFGISGETLIYKNYSKKLLFGITSGVNVGLNTIDLSNFNFQYIEEDLDQLNILTIQIPYVLHITPYRFLDIFLGTSFNINFVPYINEQDEEINDDTFVDIQDVSSGISYGLQAGINFILDEWILHFKISYMDFKLRETREYQELVEGKKTTRYSKPISYNSKLSQVVFGIGINF